jgi:hypothetical protein
VYAHGAMRASKKVSASTDIADLHEELHRLATSVATLITAAGEDQRNSWTLKEWMRRHGLSPSQAYKLFRAGKGPELMLVGDIAKRVSREADAKWVREREAAAEVTTAQTKNKHVENSSFAPDVPEPAPQAAPSPSRRKSTAATAGE